MSATTMIRPATAADALRLAELRWEFRAGRDPATEDERAFLDRCSAWMARELSARTWRAWVAVQSETIVGQLWLQTIHKIPNPIGEREWHGYISNVYVQPAARGGVGTALLETALAWARAHGVDSVILWPQPRSVALYERHGFRRDVHVMELDCRSSSSPS